MRLHRQAGRGTSLNTTEHSLRTLQAGLRALLSLFDRFTSIQTNEGVQDPSGSLSGKGLASGTFFGLRGAPNVEERSAVGKMRSAHRLLLLISKPPFASAFKSQSTFVGR
jgi:hypothetical protein